MPIPSVIVGGANGPAPGSPGAQQQVDAGWGAARWSIRPLDHTLGGVVRGHYSIGLVTGLTTGIAAGGLLFSFRHTDATSVHVLERVAVSAAITTAFTTAQPVDCDLVVARAFTVSDSGGTQVSVAGNNNKNRTQMGASSAADIRIATTAALTGGTKTLDANASAIIAFSGNGIGVASAGELYGLDRETQHPIICGPNEGWNIRVVTAQGATGVVKYYVRVDWAELAGF